MMGPPGTRADRSTGIPVADHIGDDSITTPFAVAHAFRASELDSVVASALAGLDLLSIIWLVALVVFAAIVISNLMSNTATVTVLLPILVALATVVEAPPVVLMAPVALAASFVFVLPVATPPNAIVYGSGHLELRHMVRVGLVLTLVCVPLIAGLSYLWLTLVNPFG